MPNDAFVELPTLPPKTLAFSTASAYAFGSKFDATRNTALKVTGVGQVRTSKFLDDGSAFARDPAPVPAPTPMPRPWPPMGEEPTSSPPSIQ